MNPESLTPNLSKHDFMSSMILSESVRASLATLPLPASQEMLDGFSIAVRQTTRARYIFCNSTFFLSILPLLFE
jgi:hypothetical protein